MGILHLAQHLRLADDLAFQRGGDGEEVCATPHRPGRSSRWAFTAHAGGTRPTHASAATIVGGMRIGAGDGQISQRSQVASTIAWVNPASRQRPAADRTSAGIVQQQPFAQQFGGPVR